MNICSSYYYMIKKNNKNQYLQIWPVTFCVILMLSVYWFNKWYIKSTIQFNRAFVIYFSFYVDKVLILVFFWILLSFSLLYKSFQTNITLHWNSNQKKCDFLKIWQRNLEKNYTIKFCIIHLLISHLASIGYPNQIFH